MAELPFLIVEDDPRLPHLLGTFMRTPGWRPLCAASGAEALAHFDERQEAPVVALVGMGMPDTDGVALIRQLVALRPALPVIALTVRTEEGRTLEAIRAGVRGYLFKEDLGRGLEAALNEAVAGGAPMSRPVARLPLEELQRQRQTAAAPDRRPALTERERQVIEQLARGLSYEQVALVLDISANTVRSYVRTIYDKLCVCSKTEAVLAAVRLGIIAAAG